MYVFMNVSVCMNTFCLSVYMYIYVCITNTSKYSQYKNIINKKINLSTDNF